MAAPGAIIISKILIPQSGKIDLMLKFPKKK